MSSKPKPVMFEFYFI